MFITALCIMASDWKQPKFPTNGEWINFDTSHIRTLLSLYKEEQATDRNNYMNESQKHHAKWKKPDSKGT